MENIKVLVTDDDSNLLYLETLLLEEGGYEVFQAGSGEECLDAVAAYRPDIVLLDVMLPDMNGLDVCRKIKSDEALDGTFVILVSGVLVSADFRADGLDTGADGYLTKPLSNEEFLAWVGSFVRMKRADDALREQQREQNVLIAKLHKALAEIKTLKGFLPICVSCKMIRDDQGYWDNLEAYISKHSDAVLTHGLCPQCAEVYWAEIARLRGARENGEAANKAKG